MSTNPLQCRECNTPLPPEARFCPSCGARVQRDAPDSTPDPLFESLKKAIGFQYRIERLLGRGGMGAVYLAHELALDRDVAIKVLPPEHASTPQMRERFQREARTAARMSHPHIVPLHTFGEVSGLVYFVMGYIAGESLASRLKRQGPFPPEEARTMLASICDALDYAHRQGTVHRDIKPDNILIDTVSGAPLLTDFGIAKPSLADAQLTMMGELTTAGQLIGTPHYMSPEQALGRADIDGRSDIYSFGIVAYEMISGRRPFDTENPMDELTQRLTCDPKPLGSAVSNLPSDLALAIDRCLQRDVTKRWPDAKRVREALLPSDEESEDSLPGRLLRISVTAAPVAALALGYLSVYSALSPDFKYAPRAVGILLAAVMSMVMALVATIRLRSYGLDGRSILMKAFQQPRWWRSWYPRAFRRRGDVWNRLPRELQRFRLYRGIFQIYMAGIFLPLQLMMTSAGPNLLAADGVAWLVTFVGIAMMFTERRRATKFVHERVVLAPEEASAILTAPTSGGVTWRRPPASLLLGQGNTPRHATAGPM